MLQPSGCGFRLTPVSCYKNPMSRKYRQRGYQDSDRTEGRPKGKAGKGKKGQGPRREGPRGRGMGAPTKTVFRCAACGHQLFLTGDIELDATCHKCGTDLHTCTHCRHFDTSAAFECRQEIPQRISKKSTRNECELFEPKLAQEFESDNERLDPDDARAAFDALFKL